LAEAAAVLEVVMESSGVYGDALRWQLRASAYKRA
jgi:hypothetical protein